MLNLLNTGNSREERHHDLSATAGHKSARGHPFEANQCLMGPSTLNVDLNSSSTVTGYIELRAPTLVISSTESVKYAQHAPCLPACSETVDTG
jgi:hypothetical protein